jgi:hypothetical protein
MMKSGSDILHVSGLAKTGIFQAGMCEGSHGEFGISRIRVISRGMIEISLRQK